MQSGERGCPSVPPPPDAPLSHNECFMPSGAPNVQAIRKHFLAGGVLFLADAHEIVRRAIDIFKVESNVLPLQSPITVVGDIHGQFYDLQSVFSIGGDPLSEQYLFLGDYVDRGCFSTEVALFIFALKIQRPQRMWLLRGNHECRHLTMYFNFHDECRSKYNDELYELFLTSFCALPLAAVLDDCFFCVHGGLSPKITSVDDVSLIDRFSEPIPGSAMCDLLWSDPMDEEEEEFCPKALFLYNDLRGCSCVFSYTAVQKFLAHNSLKSIIRAHEAQNEGVRMLRKEPDSGMPSIISLFSAPNYCDNYGNKGAVMRIAGKHVFIRQFDSVPHPYCLPDFLDAFTWSMPFLCDRINDAVSMLLTARCSEDASTINEGSDDGFDWGAVVESQYAEDSSCDNAVHHCVAIQRRGRIIRSKLMACAKFWRILWHLRQRHTSTQQSQ